LTKANYEKNGVQDLARAFQFIMEDKNSIAISKTSDILNKTVETSF
jgi:hypothetical protein